MDRNIKEKISALLAELRSWDVDESRFTVQELAARFELTSFIVHRIANAEGISIKSTDAPPAQNELIDSGAETQPLHNTVDPDKATQQDPAQAVDDYLSEMETWTYKKKS
jgi:hypothetical protein